MQQNNTNKDLKLINGQMIALLLFIISFIISYILAYNQKQKLEKKEPFLSDKEEQNLALFNRILATILVLYFLYTTIETIDFKHFSNDEMLRLYSSILSTISAFITLYVAMKNFDPSANHYDPALYDIETP